MNEGPDDCFSLAKSRAWELQVSRRMDRGGCLPQREERRLSLGLEAECKFRISLQGCPAAVAWLPRPPGPHPRSSLFQPGCIQVAGVKTILVESARATDTEHSAHEVRKAKRWTTWLTLKKTPHAARPLGTSGSRFGPQCALPTQKECMKSHQALATLLPHEGAPAHGEALPHHRPSHHPLWLLSMPIYKAASRLTYSFFCLLY